MKTEDDFPNDSFGKYVYAEWLEETLGHSVEANVMRAKGDLLKVVENILAGLHDVSGMYWLQNTIRRACDKRQNILNTVKTLAAHQSIRDRLKVGDWCHIGHGILNQLSNPINRGYSHCVVEALDGDQVTLSIKFTARRRRCSTTGKVNITNITSIVEEE